MENCIAPPPPIRAAKLTPITKLRLNYPWIYLRKSLQEKHQRRRDFLRFWQRARQRHIVARWQWREKLNRGLRPGIKL